MSDEVAMIVKLSMMVVFFAVMVYVGIRCRRHSVNVNGFVLGGRAEAPGLPPCPTARPIFRRLSLWGMPGSSAGNSDLPRSG